MKANRFSLILFAGLFALAGAPAKGRPLRRADVPANPVWLVHLDCDRLRSTKLGQFVQTEMEKPEIQAKLAAFQALFSVDLRTQLHGLTLYGMSSSPEDGVLLVYADFDPERLKTLARAAHDARQAEYKQNVIYSWVDEKKKSRPGEKPRTYAAVAGARVIFAQREDRVSQALDVVNGAAPSLAGSRSFPQMGAPGDTSILEAAARKLDFASRDPNAAVLKLARFARFQLGETRQQVTATLTLEAKNEDVASNMYSVAQGLVALLKLQKAKPESMKIAEALTLKHEGPRVVATLRLPATDVIEMIKANQARKAERKAAREARQQ